MMPPIVRLPFSYARRHGVLLDASSTPPVLVMRAGTALSAVAEARRWAGCEVTLLRLADATFAQRLASSYSAGHSAVEQVALGLDD